MQTHKRTLRFTQSVPSIVWTQHTWEDTSIAPESQSEVSERIIAATRDASVHLHAFIAQISQDTRV
eukprot:4099157-Prymnesium_polylepis.1